jgi:GNAT superfamily N-acetyltransferase
LATLAPVVTAQARIAEPADRDLLVSLYRLLEVEMASYSDLWSITDGLAEPASDSWDRILESDAHVVVIGSYEGHPFGFLMARIETVLPQGDGLRLGAIRLVFVDHDAREVGVGEAMRETLLEQLRDRGISRFDAHVLPGHRLAKNFFEQGGFSARHIVMHHDDADD